MQLYNQTKGNNMNMNEQSYLLNIDSNLGLKDLETFIGSRVMDRLREGGGKAIVFDWQSYRRAA